MLPLDFASLRRHGNQLAPALFGSKPRSTAASASEERFPGLELGRVSLEEPAALLARVEVEQARLWIVTGRHPVVRAVHAWPDGIVALRQRLLSWIHYRPAGFVNLFRPSLLHVRFREQKFSRLAIKRVIKSVSVGHHDKFAPLSGERSVE